MTDQSVLAESKQQQIAGHYRWQYKWQMDDAIQDGFAPKIFACQNPCDGDANRQAQYGRQNSNAQAELNDGPFFR